MSKFTIASGKKFSFTWLNSKNVVILKSVDYTSESECLNAILALRDKAISAPIEDQTEKTTTKQTCPKYVVAKSGKSFTFSYAGEDEKTVFTSKKYSTKAACLKDISAFKDNVNQDSEAIIAEKSQTAILQSLNTTEKKIVAKKAAIGLRKIPTFKKIAAKAKFSTKADELKNIDNISSSGSVIRTSRGKVPTFISGRFSEEKVTSASKAIAALNNLHHTMGFTNAEQEFKTISEETISLGPKTKFFRLQQEHQGIPVFGNQMVVSTDDEGNVETLSGHYTSISETPKSKITEAQAKEVVSKDSGNSDFSMEGLVYYVDEDDKATLCWKFSTRLYIYFVDASKGSVVAKIPTRRDYTHIASGHGVNLYGERIEFPVSTIKINLFNLHLTFGTLVDPIRNLQVRTGGSPCDEEGVGVINASSDWSSQSEVINVYDNIIKVYDFYYNVLGRRGADNNGKKINVVAKYYESETKPFKNAFFDPYITDRTQICIGSGNNYGKPIDVIGHEFTHAVNNSIWGAIYSGESGALDEALADIMGECIQDGTFDEHAEDRDSGANRNFKNPEIFGHPSRYSNYKKNGDVHSNSGIINHAAYLMQQYWPNVCFAHEMATVFYKALFYLSPSSTFLDFRSAVLTAARTMRIGIAKEIAIARAFDEVEVVYDQGKTSGTCVFTGYVIDQNGNPIIDAKVTISGYTDYTDRTGAFTVGTGPLTSITLSVTANGFRKYTDSVAVRVKNLNGRFHLGKIKLSATTTAFKFYSLSGVITNAETHKPEKDVTIRITTRENGIKEALADRYEIHLKTDEQGCYYTSVVPQGKNYVLAYKSLGSDNYFLYAGGYANVTGNASRDLTLNRNTRFFVTNICLVSKKSRAAAINAIPTTYLVVDKDLNKGAGGKYIYLGYDLQNCYASPITNLVLVKSKSKLTWSTKVLTVGGIKAQYNRLSVDLNEGAKGEFIYLCYTRSTAYKPLSAVDVILNSETLKAPWMTVHWNDSTEDADANLGTKGSPIYVLQRRSELG